MWFERAESNSVKDIVHHLKHVQNFLTETEIQKEVFGYDRSTSIVSNKKYADMLRRGLRKGLFKRLEGKFGKSRFVYYVEY